MYNVRHFHEHRQEQWKLHHNSVFNDEKGLLSLVKMIGWSKSMVQQLLPSFNIWLEKNHCHSVWRKEVLSSGLPKMVGWVWPEYQLFRKVAGDVLRRYACSSVVFDKWDSRKGRQFVFSAFKIHISLEAELTYFSVTHLHQWVGVFFWDLTMQE